MYFIMIRDKVSNEHSAVGMVRMNRGFGGQPVLMAYCASGLFPLTSEEPRKFLCLCFFACDRQEKCICALCGK